jgi:hypothetical protein
MEGCRGYTHSFYELVPAQYQRVMRIWRSVADHLDLAYNQLKALGTFPLSTAYVLGIRKYYYR